MPELPEVEHAARQLRRWMLGQRIVRASAQRGHVMRGQSAARFGKLLTGRTLERVERRGKYLMLSFDGGVGVLGHLGMTGKVVLREPGEEVPYSRARFELSGGSVVHLRDPRKFGRLTVVPSATLLALDEIAGLGPDAWEEPVDGPALRDRLGRTHREIKLALMDQRVLAGLGNIHVAETLFRAGLSPRRRTHRLTAAELSRLADSIRESLAFALARLTPVQGDLAYVEEGAPNPFLVYGKAGEPCPRCGKVLEGIVQGGRSTVYCPGCQK